MASSGSFFIEELLLSFGKVVVKHFVKYFVKHVCFWICKIKIIE